MKIVTRYRYPAMVLCFLSVRLWGGEAEPENGGLEAAREALGKLIPLAIKENTLVLDAEAWEKNVEKEPEDPEERKQFRRKRLAKLYGRSVENIQDAMLDRMDANRGDAKGELFNEVMAAGGGGAGGSGGGSHGTHHSWNAERVYLTGAIEYDSATTAFSVRFSEKIGSKRVIAVECDPALGLLIRIYNPASKQYLVLVQSPQENISVVSCQGEKCVTLSARNFATLLCEAPDQVQLLALRPLAALGLVLPPHRLLPPVIAAATTGYSAPPSETAQRAQTLIKKLGDDDEEVRESATKDLTALFPLAIQWVEQAAAQAQDTEVKSRLEKVISAHAGIRRAKPFVEKEKLHEDRAYLLEILGRIPFFKASARARLTVLYGKDYGDDPAAWPK